MVVASLLAAAWVTGSLAALARLRALPGLDGPPAAGPGPGVALCIPARNEGRDVGKALDSWLAQAYPALTILVVDDGSTDDTPGLLAERAAAHPERLRVLRNEDLPPGWLGKNHALHLASRQPEALAAPWLLFADADVQAPPDLLTRVFAFLEAHPAEILALIPAVDAGTLAERAFLPWVTLGFFLAVPVRSVPVPGRWAHCGVGAFTLVRREAYDAVDGHRGAPLEPIDDMGLARRVKAAGFMNRVALGGPGLHLRMYHGLANLVGAMRKNAMGLPVPLPVVPLAVAGVVAASLAPVLMALDGHPWAGAGLWVLVAAAMATGQKRLTGRRLDWAWLLWPLNGLPLAWGILWAFADRLRGVNHWRGREVRLN